MEGLNLEQERAIKVRSDIIADRGRGVIAKVGNGFASWSQLGMKERIKAIRRLRKTVSKNSRKIAEAISAECGRPLLEVVSQEVLPVLEMAKYCEKKYPQWLSPRRLPYHRPGFLRKRNTLVYAPLGPVAVFAPQNFPFSLGMMTLIYAALPGNTVVLKPSEKSPLVPAVIEDLLKDSGMEEAGAASLLRGGPSTGEWLIEEPQIKKIFFFGRRSSGEKIAQLCVRNLKPFVLEMGGGTTAFVCADADVEQAAVGLAWSSFYAGGHSCVSTERIFVDSCIADDFLTVFKKKVAGFQNNLNGGTTIRCENPDSEKSDSSQMGRHIHSDTRRLQDLIQDAKAKGAQVFQAGGSHFQNTNGSTPFTVISQTTPEMQVLKTELFGPVVTVQTGSNLETVADALNGNMDSMGVSIWSRDRKQAIRLANKVSAGMIWINDSSFGLPHLPWGGSGRSGWGTLFSKYSLSEVTTPKWISRHPGRFSRPRLWWGPYSPWKEKLMIKIAENFR
jgi:succinate-semialdehyde dehydrogenase/glutarate-semialdehyde dehydrogenase